MAVSLEQVASDMARDAVARTAPHELPLFRATSTAFFERADWSRLDQQVQEDLLGFGMADVATMVTPAALLVAAQVTGFLVTTLQQALADESGELIGEQVQRLFARFRSADEPAPLTPEQLARVREMAFTRARQMRLPEQQANLLADAIVGSLVTAEDTDDAAR